MALPEYQRVHLAKPFTWDKTMVYANKQANNAVENIYTVPAGKMFHFVFGHLAYYTAVNQAYCTIEIGAKFIIFLQSSITATYKVTDSGASSFSPSTPITLPAATEIDVRSSGGALIANASITGWLDDV